MKLCLMASMMLCCGAQTIAITGGVAGSHSRVGFDVDYPLNRRCLAFERGWYYPSGGYGSRLAVGCRVAPRAAVAVGTVITGPGLTAHPAVGLTVPLTRRLLVYSNHLLIGHGADYGAEYLHPIRGHWGVKLSGDCFVLHGATCSLHTGLWWRR